MSPATDYNGIIPPICSPLNQLELALGYGVSTWEKNKLSSPSDRQQLLALTFLLDAHIESLFELCMLNGALQTISCSIIERLYGFYSSSAHSINTNKRGLSLNKATPNLDPTSEAQISSNYYTILTESLPEDEPEFYIAENSMNIEIDPPEDDRKSSPRSSRPVVAAKFPEDLGIAAVTSLMTRQRQPSEIDEDLRDQQGETIVVDQVPPIATTIVSQELPSLRYRLNLIRHKNATTTDLSTLQLFKTFAMASKKADKTFVLLPIDSKKQSLPPLTSVKQIDSMTSNNLRLYFSSYHKDQHHSISGFIHILTSFTLEDLVQQLPITEWLQIYQYSIVLCKSQDEEMSLIGALCYGSLFLHRESLLQGIQAHPSWAALNNGREKQIVIDLVVRPFRSPNKSAVMIFVRAERSKKDVVQEFFLDLYDGTSKKYPRGDMLLFIPVSSKLENDYTDEQRNKYLFNHITFLGDEDCMAIYGLTNLNNEVVLKDGSTITVRTLLKSLPASPGMSRNRLFQVVDPNGMQDCVLVTFQRIDKPYIEDRKFALQQELLSHLNVNQAGKVFQDEFEGLTFVPAYHKNKGKVIKTHQPTKSHQEFVKHADNILNSPPKKRQHSESNSRNQQLPLQPIQVHNVSYSSAVQAHTTRTRSVVQPDGTRTTTTMQMSQTVLATMETRFQLLEQEQSYMKQRITGVETKTSNICDNIQAMMQHWKITPMQYKRKPEEELDASGRGGDVEYANHSTSLLQGQGDTCF